MLTPQNKYHPLRNDSVSTKEAAFTKAGIGKIKLIHFIM